jgi:hypothetical protein
MWAMAEGHLPRNHHQIEVDMKIFSWDKYNGRFVLHHDDNTPALFREELHDGSCHMIEAILRTGITHQGYKK